MATAVLKSDPFIFLEQLAAAPERVLFLDYDGTLAPFTPARDQAYPYAQVPELIDCILSTCRTRVVLVSGRSAEQIPPLLGRVPQLEIWGAHGLERIHTDGQVDHFPIPDDAVSALAHAAARLDSEGLAEFCETKRGAIAVHWRGLAPVHVADISNAAYRALASVACHADLRLTEFDGGLELRVPAGNKEYAVRAVLSEVCDDAAVAYLGDDNADEDAFAQVNTRGLTVLVRPAYRRTNAQAWIKPPEQLLQFFLDWIRACGGDV